MADVALVKKIRCFNPHGTARMESLEGVPLASFRARTLAYLIDFAIAIVIYVPAAVLVKWKLAADRHHIHVDVDFHDVYSLIFLVLFFGISLYVGKGQTLGKRLVKIRVLSLTHPQLTLWQCLERALGYGASLLEGGFGFVQYFIHPNRCCVHDRIAETIVVREPAAG